jgi:hypothetical protein
LQEASRTDDTGGAFRRICDWREIAPSVLGDNNFFVACQIDDDLPYLQSLVGGENIVHGTDYGHMDIGSDPHGLHIIAERSDLDRSVAQSIVDSNARRLWNISPSFTPAPTPSLSRTDVVAAAPEWIN